MGPRRHRHEFRTARRYGMVRAGSADAGPALVRGGARRAHRRTPCTAAGDYPAATNEHRGSTGVPTDARSHRARRPSRAPQLRTYRIRSPGRGFPRLVEALDLKRIELVGIVRVLHVAVRLDPRGPVADVHG